MSSKLTQRALPLKSSVTMSVRLPAQLRRHLEARARKENRSMNWIVNSLIRSDVGA